MSRGVSGEGGSGATVVYTFAQGETATLETLSFTIDTDGTAGTHAVRLVLTVPTVGVVARLDDFNVGGPSQTNFYTYGLGLNASACTIPSGIAVTDALPWTDLPPGTTLELIPINDVGVEIAGDAISEVYLQLSGDAGAQDAGPLLPISLLPGSLAA